MGATLLVNIWLNYRLAACKLFPKRLLRLLKTGPDIHLNFAAAEEEVREDLLGETLETGGSTTNTLETSFGKFFDEGDKSVIKEHTLRLPLPARALQRGSGSGLKVIHFAPGAPALLSAFQQPEGSSRENTKEAPATVMAQEGADGIPAKR